MNAGLLGKTYSLNLVLLDFAYSLPDPISDN